MVEISNNKEFENWLDDQEQPVHIAIASRTALRTFPFVVAPIADKDATFDTKALALSTARSILTSAVECNEPTADLKAAINSIRSSFSATTGSTYSAAETSSLSANFAIHSTDPTYFADSTKFAIRTATLSILSSDSRHSAYRSAGYFDANIVDSNTAAKLLDHPLWHNGKPESIFKHSWDEFVNDVLPTAPEFTFWRDWYQGFLDGKPLDWNLQRAVALIPDADWDKGPAHIANLIDPIWDRYKLKEQVKKLEALLPKDKKSRHGIGGNNPPPEIGDITSPEQIISISYAAIDILKGEIEETEPDKTLLQWAINALGRVLKAIGKYGIILSGVFITAGIAAAGAKYGEDIIKSVIEHATNWYNHLP